MCQSLFIAVIGWATHACRDLDLVRIPFRKLEISNGAAEFERYLAFILKVISKSSYQLGHAIFEREGGALVKAILEGKVQPGLFPHCLVQIQVVRVKQHLPCWRLGLIL